MSNSRNKTCMWCSCGLKSRGGINISVLLGLPAVINDSSPSCRPMSSSTYLLVCIHKIAGLRVSRRGSFPLLPFGISLMPTKLISSCLVKQRYPDLLLESVLKLPPRYVRSVVTSVLNLNPTIFQALIRNQGQSQDF